MRTLIATLVLSLATCAVSLAAFGADKNTPKAGTVIKRDQLPGNLKGAKEAKNSDGIPGCSAGRKVFGPKDQDVEPLLTWAGTHQDHPCFGAETLYVCRVAKNISVRCE